MLIGDPQSDNFYERLGISRDATIDTVRRAYRQQLRRYTPERAPEEFKRIREAYETLSDLRQREQYDEQPDPVIEKWLSLAFAAMKARDYSVAERYFKQVLVQQPELGYLRNMLGLCFLYQGEPAKAASQFDRLLRQPDAAAACFANAAHAYRQLERFVDAEAAFREAIRRAPEESSSDYCVSLADLLVDQKRFTDAAEVLEAGIEADGSVDFQDVECLVKLLEVRIRECTPQLVQQTLGRLTDIARTEDQRGYVALHLGGVAQQLLAAGAASVALPIAQRARSLQPHADYFALEEVARLMTRKDFEGVKQLIGSHKSFAPDGWLHTLGRDIRKLCSEQSVLAQMAPIKSAPALYTINGIGTTLYGRREEDATTQSYVATLYFVILFVPIFPICCYRVIPRDRGWSFLGKVKFSSREKRHWTAFAAAVLVLSLLVNRSGGASTMSTAPSVQNASVSALVSDSTPPESAESPVGEANSASTDNPTWYALDKDRLSHLEAALHTLDAQLSDSDREIQQLRTQINDIENGVSTYSTSDYEYQRLITRHNAAAEDYNEQVARRRMLYGSYKGALDEFNQRVEAYNASGRS